MNTALLIIIAIIGLIIMSIDGITLAKGFKKQEEKKERELNIEAAKVLLESNFLSKVDNIIDDMIRVQVDIYQVLVLATSDDLHYIKAEDQEKIHKFVVYKVTHNISSELRDLIGLVYNVKEDKDLESVISTRAKLFLINFIVEYNQEYVDNAL